ncbi:MAG TPA: ATPase, partial [Rhodospirillaceae bacterium]|nr:ATPase [Rhodospirillaceae bacterium]
QKLAQAIAAEWQAQEDKIDPSTMPLTQLAATTLDILAKEREKIVDCLLAFTRSELLCHRTERDGSLSERQQAVWQPVLDWCSASYGASFCLTCGVMPTEKREKTDQALRRPLEACNDFWLTGVRHAAETAGSLVLGLALAERHLTAEQVFEASELDVLHQTESWGKDPVTQGRHKAVRFDLEVCEKWFSLLRAV